MNRWIILILIIAAAVSTSAQTLTGTWLTTVTPPVESGVPAFQLAVTFHADGTLVATGTGGDFPALGNPCQGVWSHDRTTWVCFDYDASLQNTGMEKVRGVFDVSASTLSGKLDLTLFDPNGNELFNACCATIEGKRLEVDRLPDDSMVKENGEKWRRQ